jgi:hypothetical protein
MGPVLKAIQRWVYERGDGKFIPDYQASENDCHDI